MRVKVISFSYEPGEYRRTQGHKRGERYHRNKDGRTVSPTGNGWATEYKKSVISVGFITETGYGEAVIDYYFRGHFNRLTQKRVQAIYEALPEEINVTRHETYSGNIYYTVDDDSLQAWLEQVMGTE